MWLKCDFFPPNASTPKPDLRCLYCFGSAGAANMLSGQKKNLFAVAKTWYQQFSVHTLSLIQGNRSVCGFHLGYLDSETELIAQAMTAIMDLYRECKIKPRIDSTYHLEQVKEWECEI